MQINALQTFRTALLQIKEDKPGRNPNVVPVNSIGK